MVVQYDPDVLDGSYPKGGMVSTESKKNADALAREFVWLMSVIEARLALQFGPTESGVDPLTIVPPTLVDDNHYAKFMIHYGATPAERIVTLLALAIHVRPSLLDLFFVRNDTYGRGFTEFGGIRSGDGPFRPTIETVLYILAGDDLARRFESAALFQADHFLIRHGLISLEDVDSGGQEILISPQVLDLVTLGIVRKPVYSSKFPARLIESPLNWEDLVLTQETSDQLDEIRAWLNYGNIIMKDWGLARRISPGFKSLFCGPPGTGKSTTAALLGKSAGYDVYRIDLSLVVSKYIGETEKNLERVFRQAEDRNCILLFDEADALFGRRTQISDSHDRFANQEVSYLLQRVEDFDGVAILATNLRNNLDEAFSRRFQSIVSFPMPGPEERLILWRDGFSAKSRLAEDVDLVDIANRYKLSGGSIMNVIRSSSLAALRGDSTVIRKAFLKEGIRKEFLKEGRTL